MVNESVDRLEKGGFSAAPAVNPANGHQQAWIRAHQREAAEECGLTTWDAHGYLVLALSSMLRNRADVFIGIDEVTEMVEKLETKIFPHLVAETVPNTVSLFDLTDVLRRLVAEEISIRDLRRILMVLADWGRVESDPLMLTEYVRAGLKRQIAHKYGRGQNELIVYLLHPDLEELIREHIRHTATGSYLDRHCCVEPQRGRS